MMISWNLGRELNFLSSSLSHPPTPSPNMFCKVANVDELTVLYIYRIYQIWLLSRMQNFLMWMLCFVVCHMEPHRSFTHSISKNEAICLISKYDKPFTKFLLFNHLCIDCFFTGHNQSSSQEFKDCWPFCSTL